VSVKKAIIVESPTKTRSLARFLGKEYKLLASMGHVRDLPEDEMGVDLDGDFKPKYSILPRQRKTIGKLKKACLLYTSPSPRDATLSRMPSSA